MDRKIEGKKSYNVRMVSPFFSEKFTVVSSWRCRFIIRQNVVMIELIASGARLLG